MTGRAKVAAGAAVVLVAALLINAMLAAAKLTRLERALDAQKAAAAAAAKKNGELEQRSAEYRKKNEYLEAALAAAEADVRKQDEELETLSRDLSAARDSWTRAKRAGREPATADSLCRTLGELGHPCR